MGGLENDTIGGYNSMIAKQKDEEGEALISTVLFDNQTEVLHDRVSLDKVEPITDKEHYVRGSTALLAAVGGCLPVPRVVPADAPDPLLQRRHQPAERLRVALPRPPKVQLIH